jgi:CRISPR/Cas system-associated protein Cas5 (RAMP superfamily)
MEERMAWEAKMVGKKGSVADVVEVARLEEFVVTEVMQALAEAVPMVGVVDFLEVVVARRGHRGGLLAGPRAKVARTVTVTTVVAMVAVTVVESMEACWAAG